MNSLTSSSTARRRILTLTTVLLHHATSTTIASFSTKPTLSNPGKKRTKWPPPKLEPIPLRPNLTRPHSYPAPPQSQNPTSPNFKHSSDFTKLCDILTNPDVHPGPDLENALNLSGIEPSPEFLLQIFSHFDSSPKPLYVLFLWAEKQTGYRFSVAAFNAVINALGKAREFGRAWALIHDKILGSDRPDMNTFAIMIRRYARAGIIGF